MTTPAIEKAVDNDAGQKARLLTRHRRWVGLLGDLMDRFVLPRFEERWPSGAWRQNLSVLAKLLAFLVCFIFSEVKTMKKKLATGIAAALMLAALAFGPSTLSSHVRATRDVLRGELEGMTSDVQEAARIRILLRDMVGELLEYEGKLEDVTSGAEAADHAAERAQRELDNHRDILTRAKALLDEGRQHYQIGGKSYTKEQLCSDAKARLRNCEQLQTTVTFQRDIANKLRSAEREGTTNLRKAEQLKVEREAELKELETRLANAGLLRQVNELAGKLDDNPIGPQTEVGEAFAKFRKRVRTAERQTDYVAAESKDGLVVDWNPDPVGDAVVSQAIGQFLAGSAKP